MFSHGNKSQVRFKQIFLYQIMRTCHGDSKTQSQWFLSNINHKNIKKKKTSCLAAKMCWFSNLGGSSKSLASLALDTPARSNWLVDWLNHHRPIHFQHSTHRKMFGKKNGWEFVVLHCLSLFGQDLIFREIFNLTFTFNSGAMFHRIFLLNTQFGEFFGGHRFGIPINLRD